MNTPAETHFTISPEEWMNLSKVPLWHDYGDPGLLHNIIDEYADALISQPVAVVRPTRDATDALRELAKEMRANSERWFPGWHGEDTAVPLRVAWALGLAGEVGEVANVVKKLIRDGETVEQQDALAAEMADVFVYLLLLADECGVDLVAEYLAKVEINNARWGVAGSDSQETPE